jgi:hypothetical protein
LSEPAEIAQKPARTIAPPPRRNRRAATHGATVALLTPDELSEVAEIRDQLAELTPLDGASLDPLLEVASLQAWRLKRCHEDLARHGIIRGRADRGRLAPSASYSLDLEKGFVASLEKLAMTPAAAARLGIDVAKVQAAKFDKRRLSASELATLSKLLEKAEVEDA